MSDDPYSDALELADLNPALPAVRAESKDMTEAILRAYEIGRLYGNHQVVERGFLDSTAQQVFAWALDMSARGCAGPTEGTHANAARYAYDAAHALLQERERRSKR